MKKKLLKIFIPAIILLFILVIALIIFKRLKLSNTIKENFIPNNLQVEEFISEPHYIIPWTNTFNKIIYIPLNWDEGKLQFQLDAYDTNWPIKFTISTDYEEWFDWEIYPFFVHSLFGKNEFVIPVNAITKIDEDTFEIKLDDFWGYTTYDGKKYLYKLFSKWKINWVLLSLYRTTQDTVSIDFSLLN